MFARLDIAVPAQVQAFLDGSKPTAYVVLSSSTPELLRAVTARAREAGLRVIVGATIHDFGAHADPEIVVAGILPSHEIMPRVDVAITMGGQGSVQTAMFCGTPLVGIPLHPEQELNVALASRQGMALAIAPRHAGTAKMTTTIHRLVSEPGFRQQARRAQGLYAKTDGARDAAAAITGYLNATTERPRSPSISVSAAVRPDPTFRAPLLGPRNEA